MASLCISIRVGLYSVLVVMPQAIASRKDSPICEDVVRLKIHVRKPINYAKNVLAFAVMSLTMK